MTSLQAGLRDAHGKSAQERDITLRGFVSIDTGVSGLNTGRADGEGTGLSGIIKLLVPAME